MWSSQFSTFSESPSLSQIFYTFKKKTLPLKKKKKIHRTKVGDHSNSVSHPSILEQLSVITRALKLIKVVASKSQFVIGIASHGHSY